MKKTTVVFFLGVLVMASASCFYALAGPPGPPPHGGGFPSLLDGPPDLMEELKLTGDQLKQIRLTFVDFKDRTRKARTALMGLRDEKETLMLYGKIDPAKLAKLDEETTKLVSEVMGEELKMKREQLSKLTPEQVERLAEFLSKRKPPHGRKMMSR